MKDLFKNEDLKMQLSKDIKELRLSKNITREALCEKASVSLNALRHLEDGSKASIGTLIAILNALGKSDWLRSLSPQISINPLHMTKNGKRVRATRSIRKNKKAQNDLEHKRSYLKKYGLTPEDFLAMYEIQEGKCGNSGCNVELGLNGIGTCVDHNHSTGKVRSLLCNGCNTALGFLKEDKSRANGLASYI